MDIHKPRPWQGWREFAKEVGTIVIGVLIALGAEQVVELLRIQREIDDAQHAVAKELAADTVTAISQMRLAPCADRRLNELAVIVDSASRTGVLPPVPLPGRPRTPAFSTGAWSSVVASPIATRLPRRQLRTLALVYTYMSRADRLADEANDLWSDVYLIAGPGRPLDASSALALRTAIARARTVNIEVATLGTRLAERRNDLSLPFDAADTAAIKKVLTEPIETLDRYSICRPLTGPPPANYGQTPWGLQLADSQKTLAAMRAAK